MHHYDSYASFMYRTHTHPSRGLLHWVSDYDRLPGTVFENPQSGKAAKSSRLLMMNKPFLSLSEDTTSF